MTDQDDRGQTVLDTLNEIEALIDGKQLAAVLRIKALWRLNCCSLAVYGFGEGDRAGNTKNFYPRPSAPGFS